MIREPITKLICENEINVRVSYITMEMNTDALDDRSNAIVSATDATRPSTKKHKTLQEFLINHRHIKKTGEDAAGNQPSPTHTRIGDDKSGIHGGSYSIPDDAYDEFMRLYYQDVVSKNKHEYLTEKQLTNGRSPIAVDLDLHFDLNLPERVYTQDCIDELVDVYLAELATIYQFDESTAFPVFLFEKETVNRVPEKNITKDGLHLIIGIQMEHAAQCILRSRVKTKIAECWGDFPLKNTWNDVFDEGISKGTTNWQLYGSCKPNHKAYRLTNVYKITYDPDDGEFVNHRGDIKTYLTETGFKQLSVRYPNHTQCFYKSAFMGELDALRTGNDLSGARRKTPVPDISEDAYIAAIMEGGSGAAALSRMRTAEDVETNLNRFLDIIPSLKDYVLREMYEYSSILPESYYGNGSYSKWMRVGWALKNTSNRLLIVWIAFSAKSSTFNYSDIPSLCEKWTTMDKKCGGVTNRSIIYWAMHENPAGSEAIRKNTVGHYLDLTINSITANTLSTSNNGGRGCGDYDIAVVLHQMFKDEYVCSDVKNGVWWRFKNHRWKQIDSGTYLRRAISNELRELYEARTAELQNYLVTLDTETERYKLIKARIETVVKIMLRLGQTFDKKNIMQEARDLFYDSEFYERLDSNPHLLCCKNGVVDFKEKAFRKGLPEDYLTKCTEINYTPLSSSKHRSIIPEINDFMAKLFVKADLREYMWNHLSAVLVGMPSLNQTFHNYIGVGQNGKSVLTDLMSQTLGSYKVAAPISIITQGRGKIGGLAPEIVALKGARYVVMQEPESTDVVHEGPMKELVSGVEPITARAPYMIASVTFVPQFSLVVCCNQFMAVRTQDHGTWRRFRVTPFESLFTEKPVDNDPDKPYQFKLDCELKDKFPVWRETFLAMLVDRAYANQGKVTDCDIVMSASNAYRERQDYLAEFTRDKVARCPGSTIRKSQLSEEFRMWYSTNFGTKNPSPKNLHDYMDRQYGKNISGVWSNVKLKFHDDDNGDFQGVNEEDLGDEIVLNEI